MSPSSAETLYQPVLSVVQCEIYGLLGNNDTTELSYECENFLFEIIRGNKEQGNVTDDAKISYILNLTKHT